MNEDDQVAEVVPGSSYTQGVKDTFPSHAQVPPAEKRPDPKGSEGQRALQATDEAPHSFCPQGEEDTFRAVAGTSASS